MNTETATILGYSAITLLISTLSVWIGYQVGNWNVASLNSILHQLKDEFKQVACLSKDWTSEELVSLSSFLISSHLRDEHRSKLPTVQDKSHKIQAKPDLVFWINDN